MAKCIFCGKKPESKTKEHVLSDWLIRLTGNKGKIGNFGFDYNVDPPKQRKFTFDSFTFPACDSCNQDFKLLEKRASAVIKKMIIKSNISELELNTLLDWLDKIRIGLFLAFNTLDKNYIHFIIDNYIKHNIGLYDRMVIINRIDEELKMLSVRGCDSIAFRLKSSCFSLVINNLFLFSYVSPFLFPRRLGFPFYSKDSSEMSYGKKRIMYPLIRKPFIFKGTEIYQPMFPTHSENGLTKYYDSDYVKEKTLIFDKGVGKIFIKKEREISLYKNENDWIPKPPDKNDYLDLAKNLAKQVCLTQNEALKNSKPNLDSYTEEKKKEIIKIGKKASNDNKRIIQMIDSNKSIL